jgi:cytoskeleton protein RodZ
VVLDDLRLAPADRPVVGPQVRAAREKLRLSIDQVADRTRIRPHVIEAIEVDDFAPCGGDFYARGHLRTLARILGLDSAPLLAAYDEHYADAPVDLRRVFESEAATGGAIRGTRGGRNWTVLVAAVMAAVLVWSVAKLVMGGPAPIGDTPVLNQSGGISSGSGQAAAVPVTLTAAGGGATVVVRDGGGDVVYDGNLAFGQTLELKVAPPVRISTSDGSVTASIDGGDARALGTTGEATNKTLVP